MTLHDCNLQLQPTRRRTRLGRRQAALGAQVRVGRLQAVRQREARQRQARVRRQVRQAQLLAALQAPARSDAPVLRVRVERSSSPRLRHSARGVGLSVLGLMLDTAKRPRDRMSACRAFNWADIT